MAKRKGIAWGPSNPLYRWQHRKANKVVKRKGSSVTSMAKRKSRRYRFAKRMRWHRPKRIPILPVVGFGVGLLAAQNELGWSSPIQSMQEGDMGKVAQGLISNLTGVNIALPGVGGYQGPPIINLGGILNPFDFGNAAALKGLFWGAIGSKVLGMLGVKRSFDNMTAKIPLLKRVTL